MPEFTTEQLKEFEKYLIETREYWLLKKRSMTMLVIAIAAVFLAFGFTTWQAGAHGARTALVENGIQDNIDLINQTAGSLAESSAVVRLLDAEKSIGEIKTNNAEDLLVDWYVLRSISIDRSGESKETADVLRRRAYEYVRQKYRSLPASLKDPATENVNAASSD